MLTENLKPGAGKKPAALLVDQVYERLKFDIITLQLEPGSKVAEAKLSERYQVGKAPVRSALLRLIHEGLVVSAPRRAHRVGEVTLNEVEQVFGLRKLMEPEAARLAAHNINLGLLQKLEKPCRATYRRGDPQQEFAFLEANRQFHCAILDASGNKRLAKWGRQLQDASMRFLYLAIKETNQTLTWQHGHQEELDALKARDAKRAEAIALRELVRSEKSVLDVLSNMPSVRDINLGARRQPDEVPLR